MQHGCQAQAGQQNTHAIMSPSYTGPPNGTVSLNDRPLHAPSFSEPRSWPPRWAFFDTRKRHISKKKLCVFLQMSKSEDQKRIAKAFNHLVQEHEQIVSPTLSWEATEITDNDIG